MGAEQPMMRARQRGGGCRVPGHGAWCELATERPARGRRDDRRVRDREITDGCDDNDRALIEDTLNSGRTVSMTDAEVDEAMGYTARAHTIV